MIDPLSDLHEARRREDLLGVSVEARRLIEQKPSWAASGAMSPDWRWKWGTR